jgi:hypothetical protein
MRTSQVMECLIANAKVITVLGSNSASSDTVESEGGGGEEVLNKVHKNPTALKTDFLNSIL